MGGLAVDRVGPEENRAGQTQRVLSEEGAEPTLGKG